MRWFVVAICLGGCGELLGLDDFGDRSEAQTGSGAGMSSTTPGSGPASGGSVPCTGECVPLAPVGWDGPLIVVPGDACRDLGAPVFTAGTNGMATPPTCSQCICGTPKGSCVTKLELSDETTCMGTNVGPTVSDSCFNFNAFTAVSIKTFDDSPQLGGTCPASGGVPTLPPPVFENPVAGCAASRDTCDEGVCITQSGDVCVSHTGDVPCEGGVYTDKRTLVTTGQDNRGCSMCSCGTAGGATCNGGIVTLYADAVCGMAELNLVAQFACNELGTPKMLMSAKTSWQPNQLGECLAMGGSPQGTLAIDPFTVCCRPP